MKHFTEVDLLEMSYLPPGEATASMLHLAGCEECRDRYERLQQKLRGLQEKSCQRVEDKPDTFWTRQRLSILRSVETAQTGRQRVPRLPAIAAAVILLAGSALVLHRSGSGEHAPLMARGPARSSTSVFQHVQRPGSDEVLQEIQASHDPWNSDELRSYHGVVEWESWTPETTQPAGGTL